MSGAPTVTWKRTVDVFVATTVSGPTVRLWLNDEADRNARALVSQGRAPARGRKFINGVEGADPTSLRLDGTGSIAIRYSRMAEAMPWALNFAVSHSPQGATGAYRASWFFLVNGQPWLDTDYRTVPLGAEIILSNRARYHRKIDVGALRISVAPQIVEQTRQAVMRRYPAITAERRFITWPGGYILKGRQVSSGLSWNKQQKRYVQARMPENTNRADSRKGQPMTYPSLVMYEAI